MVWFGVEAGVIELLNRLLLLVGSFGLVGGWGKVGVRVIIGQETFSNNRRAGWFRILTLSTRLLD